MGNLVTYTNNLIFKSLHMFRLKLIHHKFKKFCLCNKSSCTGAQKIVTIRFLNIQIKSPNLGASMND